MKLLLPVLLVVTTVPATGQDRSAVLMSPVGNQHVEIRIDEKPFATYRLNTKGELPKPFLLPARAADGTVLTRPLEDPEDHPHHKGVWVAVDKVNDVDFWAEKGKIITTAMDTDPVRVGSWRAARLRVSNSWQSLDGKPVVDEETAITVFPNRLLTYDIRFIAKHGPVEFGDTKEGLFGFRMVDTLREKETGKVVNADRKNGTKECWGQTSAWVDYYGTVNGKTYGVALFDHPKNFRKSRYHVRNYGLFSISPFGDAAYTKGQESAKPVKLAKGETLRLRYAMYIHDGDTQAGKVADVYKQYLEVSDADKP